MEKLSDHIIEGNSLMAKFMGFQITKEPEEYNYKYSYWTPDGVIEKYSFFGVLHSENYERKFLNQMSSFGQFLFHKSWDWLMPVIEKINQEIPKCIPNNVILPDYMFKMKMLRMFNFEGNTGSMTEIYDYCLEFLKWYYVPKVAY